MPVYHLRKDIFSMIAAMTVLACLAASSVVLATSWDKANDTLLAVIATLLAVRLSIRRKVLTSPDYQVLLLLLLILLALPFAIVTKVFGHLDMLKFLFHLEFGTEGTAFAGMELETATSVVSASLLFFSAWMLRGVLNSRIIIPIVCATLIAVNPAVRFYTTTFIYANVSEESLKEDIAVPGYDTLPNGDLPDIIWVYLEGLERGFGNQELFGDVYDPLNKLAERGIEFLEVEEFPGTGSSISGNVATQCGLPLLPNGFRARNTFGDQVNFLANSVCLGDVLSSLGYHSNFVMGSRMSFAGFDHFLTTHKYDNLFGSSKIEAAFTKDEVDKAQASWGPDDQMLFDFAQKTYLEAIKSGPVSVVIQTMGPHGKSSHLSRRCTDNQIAITTRDVPAAVGCTAEIVFDFVKNLEAAAPTRKRLFVLVSDHLAHKASATPLLEKGPRKNTFIVFGDAIEQGIKNYKRGSLVDVYPTILQLLEAGKHPHHGGFGISLLTDEPTFMETHDYDELHWRISTDVGLVKSLWAEEPLRIDAPIAK